MKRTPSTLAPDMNLDSVRANDIESAAIENRHFANDEILATKVAMLESSAAIPVVIVKDITLGAAPATVLAVTPFKMEIDDVIIQPKGASTNGTMTLLNGTNAITNAMICAVDKTIARATTIDVAYGVVAKGGALMMTCAGDVPASTIAKVTILAHKID
jgi:hypothetical protein